MPVEVGLWRVDNNEPSRLRSTGAPLESQLETFIEADPTILGTPIMIIGRQVPTAFGTFIDLLGVDEEGVVHILELKRNRTPRDVVAQALDYGSWIQSVSNDDIREIFERHRPGITFDEAFAENFGGVAPPDELNDEHQLTVIASELDSATERIVRYLNTGYGVPINVLFFRYFNDEGRSYLARTWLIEEGQAATSSSGRRPGGSKEQWNGLDWYVSFGEDSGARNWDDARRYGFVSAGGGEWFSRTLRALPVGARIWAHIPKNGYVGVGTVIGEAMPAEAATLDVNGAEKPLRELDLNGVYRHEGRPNDQDRAEYVVPVEWISTKSREDAVWKQGFFANQNSACKLRKKFTLDELAKQFGVTS